MKLNELRDLPGARTKRKRVGRGVGSGTGKTCGRGHKGQKSRSGVALKGFEGGQMPIQMRLPKRGFRNRNRKRFAWIGLGRINSALASGQLAVEGDVDEAALVASGLIRRIKGGVRVLADGGISVPVNLVVTGASATARQAVEKAGGSLTLKAAVASEQTGAVSGHGQEPDAGKSDAGKSDAGKSGENGVGDGLDG